MGFTMVSFLFDECSVLTDESRFDREIYLKKT